MRFLLFLPAVLSALTGAIGAFAQGTSGQNAVTYPLGGSLDGNAPLTITWTVCLTVITSFAAAGGLFS